MYYGCQRIKWHVFYLQIEFPQVACSEILSLNSCLELATAFPIEFFQWTLRYICNMWHGHPLHGPSGPDWVAVLHTENRVQL